MTSFLCVYKFYSGLPIPPTGGDGEPKVACVKGYGEPKVAFVKTSTAKGGKMSEKKVVNSSIAVIFDGAFTEGQVVFQTQREAAAASWFDNHSDQKRELYVSLASKMIEQSREWLLDARLDEFGRYVETIASEDGMNVNGLVICMWSWGDETTASFSREFENAAFRLDWDGSEEANRSISLAERVSKLASDYLLSIRPNDSNGNGQ